MNVSHATVLRNIGKLEKDLQIRLFDRFQTGYRITPDGEEIYDNALLMESNAEEMLRRLKGKDSIPEGLLRIALPENSIVNFLPLIGEFYQRFPKIQVSINGAVSPRALNKLELDVAISITNTPPEEMVGRQLIRINFDFYAARSYLLNTPGITPEECDWITWAVGDNPGFDDNLNLQEENLFLVTAKPHIVMQADSHSDVLAAVRAGMGVGLLSNKVAIDSNLVALSFSRKTEKYGVWILTHPDLRRSARVQAFMRFMSENADKL